MRKPARGPLATMCQGPYRLPRGVRVTPTTFRVGSPCPLGASDDGSTGCGQERRATAVAVALQPSGQTGWLGLWWTGRTPDRTTSARARLAARQARDAAGIPRRQLPVPVINVQSILARHEIIRELDGDV